MTGSVDSRRMTPAQFQSVAARITASASVTTIARSVLVDGKKAIDVARDEGVTRGFVSKIVARFWQARHNMETLTVTLPTERAAIVRDWHREAQRELE